MPSETPIGNVIRPSVIPIRTKGFVKHDVPVVCSPNAVNIYQAAGFVGKGAVASQLVGEDVTQVNPCKDTIGIKIHIADGDGTAGLQTVSR